eukprot:CAMPEP_0201540806 /NCGR_PEP_ID=MMETSP0161_2-20130828/71141_1 /ASSEMBLY_ACC=CAM_ASM_000251 /TAXON_ID=180227 /ORGANISM="Neoparamoeba aestuarina, Strain SoJaBio B1-5/56/2" /LENGTH=328 /DNA_ID=CAMNT_0047948301 /DNA_START=141 /DNA_END=1128 /DNA_ORIENTATION=+
MSSSLQARANPYLLGPVRIPFDEKRDDGRKTLVAKWPLYVWGIRVCVACAKLAQEPRSSLPPRLSASSLASVILMFADLKNIVLVSLAVAKKMVSRWIFRSELWDSLLPALIFAITSHRADYFIKEYLTQLWYDPMDLEVARAKKERVLSLIHTKLLKLEHEKPGGEEVKVLSSLYRSLKPFTPVRQSMRYFFLSLISSLTTMTITYPMRTIVFRLIVGENLTDLMGEIMKRCGFMKLMNGYFYSLLGIVTANCFQYLASSSVTSMYDAIDETIEEAETSFATSCEGKTPLNLSRLMRDSLRDLQVYFLGDLLEVLLCSPALFIDEQT